MNENNSMPTMPSVNTETEHSLPGESGSSETVPTPEVVTPSIIEPDENNSQVEVPLIPKTGINVTATRKGFYGQMRKKEGDKFSVRKFESLGEWMKCDDPALERKRVKFFKDKKAKK